MRPQKTMAARQNLEAASRIPSILLFQQGDVRVAGSGSLRYGCRCELDRLRRTHTSSAIANDDERRDSPLFSPGESDCGVPREDIRQRQDGKPGGGLQRDGRVAPISLPVSPPAQPWPSPPPPRGNAVPASQPPIARVRRPPANERDCLVLALPWLAPK